MTAMEIFVIGWAVVNAWWSIENWQKYRQNIRVCTASEVSASQMRTQAQELLRGARKIADAAAVEQEHKVCDECGRITVKHTTDESGKTTCVNCATDLARRVVVNG